VEASPIPLRWEGANQQPIIQAVCPPFPTGEGWGEASPSGDGNMEICKYGNIISAS